MTLRQRVLHLALGLRVSATDTRSSDHLTQAGEMRQLGAKNWMTFTARQSMEARGCAFDWQARFAPLGLIHVRDALVGGVGMLDVKALGVKRCNTRRPRLI